MQISKLFQPLCSVLAVPAALTATLLTGHSWLLPLLSALIFYPAFIHNIRHARFSTSFRLAVLWAVAGTITIISFSTLYPSRTDEIILNGESYCEEMMAWIETGVGKESDPARFIPEHLLHFSGFALATLLSAGLAGLALGSYLLNYMNVYVATYAAVADYGLAGWILAWHPWALIRVAAYLGLGVYGSALSLRILSRAQSIPPARWLYISLGGVALDIIMKSFMAPGWGRLLNSVLPVHCPGLL